MLSSERLQDWHQGSFVKIYFVAPKWEKSQYFPSHHTVQIGIQSKKIKVEANEDQNFQDVEESLCGIEFIQERRALGFKVLLQIFDRMIKMKKKWTYGFSNEISVVSIGARSMTSISLFKIKQKGKEIFENLVPTSKVVHNRLCMLLKHNNHVHFYYKK
ncbi:hypothetical protein SLE2022_210940 [Rubroshorea leprosula]